MAASSGASKDDVVCRFFLSSFCRDEERCPFSHDSTRSVPDTVCRFYLQDKCRFGDYCKYDHVRVKSGNGKFTSRNEQSAGPSGTRSEHQQTATDSRCKQSGNWPQENQSKAKQIKFSNLQTTINNTESANVGPGSSDWVNAPEFVPKTPMSYADTLKAGMPPLELQNMSFSILCPYFQSGDCPYDTQCSLLHGDMCELCGKACLNPYDEQQRKDHIAFCEKEIEQDMELSFAIQRSIDKTCGICMDVIMDKEPLAERRFGILEKCNHIFCLSCIRTWRNAKNREKNQQLESSLDPVVTRACPECRVSSDFITPSQYWVETEEEKSKLIKDYKEALGKVHCKYFQMGEGECPFGGACFYMHAKPDGTKVNLPLPTRRRRQNQDGEVDYLGRIFLWDYLDFREENILMHLQLGLDDFGYNWSDSEDDSSDW